MPKKKLRTYQDYRELGSELYAIKLQLMKASLKAQAMLGKSKPEYRRLQKVLKDLGSVRASLDTRFCEDIPEHAVPEGEPPFPLYPANYDK
jgi:hypothetical protein